MDKVKSALSDFTKKSGHHDTTVHEAVAPAVVHETVKPHQHEEINTAVDKEVHQDHYHRTVQPIHDREVLPETHTAKLGAVQHREFDHRDHDSTKRNLIQEQAQFRDERRVESTTQSQSVAPTIGGEHVHHHIHETIQPVVKKEVIQPNVVHTTVPIHEVHHNAATHHETTALPTLTMDEFKNKGGVLSGREERYDEFQGVPKNIGGGSAGGFGHVRDGHHEGAPIGGEHHKHGDYHDAPNHANSGFAGSGTTASGLTGHHTAGHTANPADRNNDGKVDARDLTGRSGTTGSSTTGRHVGTDGAIGSSTTGMGFPKTLTEDKSRANLSSGRHDTTTGHKPSLMDKLNPKKDSDGDGKAGFMK
ncbi:hypothetical protein EK21DRAFT_55395 [Setomelanomma holmii]|uniref:Allergen n=1 Tax=Setomelanomma holmii TaxID=210430 RepID=A0A9P4HK14_9PLEO|nr:hypothetical protein EK21DRAFT_55395 [Setomelanomma holmii]